MKEEESCCKMYISVSFARERAYCFFFASLGEIYKGGGGRRRKHKDNKKLDIPPPVCN